MLSTQKEKFPLVITGHIDHGKSTLMGRLLVDTGAFPAAKVKELQNICAALHKPFEYAFVVDHFQEEREKEMTIDTTQMIFQSDKRQYVIIDAPGHKEFIKNMITGAAQAAAAVLVVDGHKGLEEQSRRHAFILKMLGITTVIVAVNKMDLLAYKEKAFRDLSQEITAFLKKTGLTPQAIIPISAAKGENITKLSSHMPWYKGMPLLPTFDTLQNTQKKQHETLVFPVQDVYELDHKKIAVGRVESGSITAGEKIFALPQNQTATIQSIVVFEEEKKSAGTGESIGVTLMEPLKLKRGMVLSNAPLLHTQKIRTSVLWLNEEPLDLQKTYTFSMLTQSLPCHVADIEGKIDTSTLEPIKNEASPLGHTELGTVTFTFDTPLVIDTKALSSGVLECFVLEHNNNICASGMIEVA